MLFISASNAPAEIYHLADGVDIHAIQCRGIDNPSAKVSCAVVLQFCAKLLLWKQHKLEQFLITLKVQNTADCLKKRQFEFLGFVDNQHNRFIVNFSVLK